MRDSVIELERLEAMPAAAGARDGQTELSIVMPCLNERETLGACIEVALAALREHGIAGEIVVADNGSTDGSQELARRLGVRLTVAGRRGYGNALMAGIAAARSRYVLIGDADGGYDFRELAAFVEKLRDGYDLVQGYVGLREPHHRQSDVWTILHDLFAVENPPTDHADLHAAKAACRRSMRLSSTRSYEIFNGRRAAHRAVEPAEDEGPKRVTNHVTRSANSA